MTMNEAQEMKFFEMTKKRDDAGSGAFLQGLVSESWMKQT